MTIERMTSELAAAPSTRDDGWGYPPDAGDSILGTYGLGSWLVAWLLRANPEVLELTPKQFLSGLRAPRCPSEWFHGDMRLRIAEAEGRRPKRLVWRCYKGQKNLGDVCATVELKNPAPARTRVKTNEIIAATRRGMMVDYQPNVFGQKTITLVPLTSKPRKRSKG